MECLVWVLGGNDRVMMTLSNGNFSALLALCEGSPVDSLYKGQWRGALIFSLICARTSCWSNNRNASDLRRRHTHNGVTVIYDNVQLYPISFHNSFCYPFPHCIVMWNILRCYSTWDPIVYQCQYSVFSISYLQISLMTIWTLVQKPKLHSSVA